MKQEIRDKFTGHIVKKGDTVVLLYKQYGFRGIDDAFLIKVKYCGKGQWGHEFKTHYGELARVRYPEVVLVK